jgi:Fic family protein
MKIGHYQQQPQGFKAFIPAEFPPREGYSFSSELIHKAAQATLALGKLDGITHILPDVDFFLYMYTCKDAASSSQIEGTQATMVDAIEATAKTSSTLPQDVDDILHYIKAINYGLERVTEFPLSTRLIKEIHKILMHDARATHFSDPGNFRSSQNWIGGTNINSASFVPPPVEEMKIAMSDLEKFFHDERRDILPIIKIGLAHAQFETIHPFLDGNGRTGRMLITMMLCLSGMLEYPVLFLSSYFKKYQQNYYDALNKYHNNDIVPWVELFLDGVCVTAVEAVETAKKINLLREQDLKKIHSLGKTSSKVAVDVLFHLFKAPVINVAGIINITGYTRQGAQKVIDKLVVLDILKLKNDDQKYDRSYIYSRYVELFN